MIQPGQNPGDTGQIRAYWQHWPGDHQHRQAQRPGGVQLGPRTAAARVFANNKLGFMLLHQGGIAGDVKRPTGNDHLTSGQRRRAGVTGIARVINQTQQVMMLGLGGKPGKMHPAQRQKHPFWRGIQRGDGGVNIGHPAPLIAVDRLPFRSAKRRQWQAKVTAGLRGISAHLCGKGVRRVDHMGDIGLAQIVGQSGDTAKAAHPHRHRLGTGAADPARVRKDCRNALRRHGAGKGAGLGRTAEDQQESGHG